MGLYSRALSKALNPTIDLFWWYRPFNYGRLCPIYFYKELGFGGFVFMLQVFDF
jgi:hypothetical protein